MLGLEIDLTSELREFQQEIEASLPKIQNAVRRAVEKTAKWFEVATTRELGQALQFPRKVLTVRFRHRFTSRDQSRAVNIWLGINPVEARHLGKGRQTKQGVTIRKRMFDGAFLATMPSGHSSVWERQKGVTNRPHEKRPDGQWTQLPIKKVRLDIATEAEEIFKRYYARVEAELMKKLQQELRFVSLFND
ncbi:phage tail protein [Rheinheimera sp.]|uniref:phage tail protein n=1 Tax=Rheinheimera sp. TaxID=1869214 RepID=UPI00307E7B48